MYFDRHKYINRRDVEHCISYRFDVGVAALIMLTASPMLIVQENVTINSGEHATIP